jgi:peptidylprolyl isomerase
MLPATLAASLALAFPAAAQEAPPRSSSEAVAQSKTPAPSPGEIVVAAPTNDWVAIAPTDLLVMTLAPDRDGNKRQVTIQLMPPPFSQGWVGNIRKLAAAHWWDGLAITRVQDNYVVQWGDPDGEDKAKAKALPKGLRVMSESNYKFPYTPDMFSRKFGRGGTTAASYDLIPTVASSKIPTNFADPYAAVWSYAGGFPVAFTEGPVSSGYPPRYTPLQVWPVHCYGMVGVGRNYSPDTGSGAELYTVIGHAPRHLDRNIALVGRVVEGIEHLSSLPRGTGALGFYEKAEQRVPIASIRLASELPASEQPRFEYLSTESGSFAEYADARANRRDPFFIVPAGGADICNIPVPVRRAPK